ncbi:MAG: hypothetical protein JKY42_09375 [Flavobacteriales bacterium]|nr:hypothetical protein [Flavobacteriales bacterium]
MKFLESEHADVVRVIETKGFNSSAFSFVKKKGMLHISHASAMADFMFFRKTETKLNSTLKWTNKTYYFISKSRKTDSQLKWKSVLNSFENWLNQLSD